MALVESALSEHTLVNIAVVISIDVGLMFACSQQIKWSSSPSLFFSLCHNQVLTTSSYRNAWLTEYAQLEENPLWLY